VRALQAALTIANRRNSTCFVLLANLARCEIRRGLLPLRDLAQGFEKFIKPLFRYLIDDLISDALVQGVAQGNLVLLLQNIFKFGFWRSWTARHHHRRWLIRLILEVVEYYLGEECIVVQVELNRLLRRGGGFHELFRCPAGR